MTILICHPYHPYPAKEIDMDGPYVSRAIPISSRLGMAMDNASGSEAA